MSRHINWGLIFIVGLLVVAAATTPYWLPYAEPLQPDEEVADVGFVCPPNLEEPICEALDLLNATAPEEAANLVDEWQAEPVPAPANEADPASVEAEIDPNTVSVFTNTRIRLGQLEEISDLFYARGTVNVIELVADDTIQRWVRFENDFEISPSPEGLRVYLGVNAAPTTSAELFVADTEVLLGLLKGDIGGQNYKLDDEIDITQYSSIVIYDQTFDRVYSYATLQQPLN